MRSLATAVAVCSLTFLVTDGANAAGDPLGPEELQALNASRRCERAKPGHVIYAGDSANLRACLVKLGDRQIAELRVTSGGGDAWKTLEAAREYSGRIDLVVVEGLCASSCANYLLPVAKRVRVNPRSYVLLHGALVLNIAPDQIENLRRDLTNQLREQNEKQPKKLTEQEITWKINGALADFRDALAKQVPVQDEFARTHLRCHDWLEPNRHLSRPIPSQYGWLLVTPAMAHRCLENTQVDAWWPPEAEKQFDPRLGFMRARR